MGTGWSSLGALCSSSIKMKSPNPFEVDADGFTFLISYSYLEPKNQSQHHQKQKRAHIQFGSMFSLRMRERESSDTWGQGGCVFAICAANFLNNTADQSLTTKNLKTSFDKNSKNFLLED